MNPVKYLIGQVYDNLQYTLQEQTYDSFNNEDENQYRYLNPLLEVSYENNVSPVWLLNRCFSYHVYQKRRLKHLPLLMPINLTKDYVRRAYTSGVNYEYARHQDLFFPVTIINNTLSQAVSVYYRAYLQRTLPQLYQGLRKQQQKDEEVFRDVPYRLNDTELEDLRLLLKDCQNPWEGMLLLEGAESYNSSLFLLSKKPANALFKHCKTGEVNYYCCGIKQAENGSHSVGELLYLQRAFNYMDKAGLTIG